MLFRSVDMVHMRLSAILDQRFRFSLPWGHLNLSQITMVPMTMRGGSAVGRRTLGLRDMFVAGGTEPEGLMRHERGSSRLVRIPGAKLVRRRGNASPVRLGDGHFPISQKSIQSEIALLHVHILLTLMSSTSESLFQTELHANRMEKCCWESSVCQTRKDNKIMALPAGFGPREVVWYDERAVVLRGSLSVEWLDWKRKSEEIDIPSSF